MDCYHGSCFVYCVDEVMDASVNIPEFIDADFSSVTINLRRGFVNFTGLTVC